MGNARERARCRMVEAERLVAQTFARHRAALQELRAARAELRTVATPPLTPSHEDSVEEADLESFPASDPPSWTGAAAT